MSKVIFYLVRHGETDWNRQGRIQGQADIHLNETGRSQAADLALRLQDLSFKSCYSSDLQRAYDTAKIILTTQNQSLAIQTDPRLRERDFKDWEGKLFVDFQKAEKENRLFVETKSEIVKRVLPFLESIADKEKHGTVLILTHGGIIHNLLMDLLDLSHTTAKVSVKNTGYVKLVYTDKSWHPEEMHNIEIKQLISLA